MSEVADDEVHHRSRESRKQLRILADALAQAETPGGKTPPVSELRDIQRRIADIEAELTGSVAELPPREGNHAEVLGP